MDKHFNPELETMTEQTQNLEMWLYQTLQ